MLKKNKVWLVWTAVIETWRQNYVSNCQALYEAIQIYVAVYEAIQIYAVASTQIELQRTTLHIRCSDSFTGYDVPTTVCPDVLLKLIALTDKTTRMLLPAMGKLLIYDNSKVSS